MNKLKNFENPEFGQVRTINLDGIVYFVGKDIAEILGYKDENQALRKHVDTEDKLTRQIDGIDQRRNMVIINESGLFSLILSSKLPRAKQFKRWVTSEILPTIRKTGGYIADADLMVSTYFSDTNESQKELIRALLVNIESLQPRAQYCDAVLSAHEALPITVIAKDYGMTAQAMNDLLYRLRVQYFKGYRWYLFKEYANAGYTTMPTQVNGAASNTYMCWTQRGRNFIYNILKEIGVVPVFERIA